MAPCFEGSITDNVRLVSSSNQTRTKCICENNVIFMSIEFSSSIATISEHDL